jgi:phosphate transport system substrate-binding protein
VLRWTIRRISIAAIVYSFLAFAAVAQERLVIVGSGSNLPIHLYQSWIRRFNASNSRIQVDYLPLGSSESIRQVSSGIGDFGAGEIILSDKEEHGSPIGLLSIPTALVAIVPIYNLPGKPVLNFSGQLLAQIYLGDVRNWSDPRITRLNAGTKLPDLPMQVVHRSSGKGSNFIFTDFLSKTDSRFRLEIGRSPSPKWPVGIEANRGQDMVNVVSSTPGSIGYVEMSFVGNSGVGYGRVENASGQFVEATTASISAACGASMAIIPEDFRVSMTNAAGRNSYPIVSFSWIYLPTSGAPLIRRRAVKEFLLWSLRNGQEVAGNVGYTRLPDDIVAKALEVVDSLP